MVTTRNLSVSWIGILKSVRHWAKVSTQLALAAGKIGHHVLVLQRFVRLSNLASTSKGFFEILLQGYGGAMAGLLVVKVLLNLF